ncbi:hypothetical protein B0H17DRAFT_1065225 [Mycena rosella]|uniref:Uncharacterized protein n=1 Tax=Mycena rosella TaxID=1033263 RepID=A0AAD7DI88_MYCRO|nr:hypothetical protein B0H17DRAFT_1065225 [Mycena rosella]
MKHKAPAAGSIPDCVACLFHTSTPFPSSDHSSSSAPYQTIPMPILHPPSRTIRICMRTNIPSRPACSPGILLLMYFLLPASYLLRPPCRTSPLSAASITFRSVPLHSVLLHCFLPRSLPPAFPYWSVYVRARGCSAPARVQGAAPRRQIRRFRRRAPRRSHESRVGGGIGRRACAGQRPRTSDLAVLPPSFSSRAGRLFRRTPYSVLPLHPCHFVPPILSVYLYIFLSTRSPYSPDPPSYIYSARSPASLIAR